MRQAKVILTLVTLSWLAFWLIPMSMMAEDTNQVALVIRHSNQTVETACVEFTEPEISGLEALQRSGLSYEIEAQGLGAIVCSIGQTGCAASDCWCQCKGGDDCIYWSYWHNIVGEWTYSMTGASAYSVQNGDVDGWSWGPGSISEAFPPPDTSFEEVCQYEQGELATATATPTFVAFVPEASATDAGNEVTVQLTATATMIPTQQTTMTATPTPTAAQATPALKATVSPTAVAATILPSASPEIVENQQVLPGNQPVEPQATATDEALSIEIPHKSVPTIISETPTTQEVNTEPGTTGLAIADAGENGGDINAPLRQAKVSPVQIGDDRAAKLVVVGSGVQLPPKAIETAGPAENPVAAPADARSPAAPQSYIVFLLIMAVLIGLLVTSSIRRRRRFSLPREQK